MLTPPVTSEPALPSQQESSGFLVISEKKNEPKPAIAPQPPTHEQQPIDSNVASTSSSSQKNAVAPSIKSDSASSSSSQVAPKNAVAPSIRSDSTSSSTPGTFTNSFSEVKNSFGVSSAFTGIGSSSSSAFTGIGSSSWPPSAAAPMSDLHLNDANAPLPETGKSVFANQEQKKPIVVINAEDVKQGLYNSYSEEDEDEDENEKPEDSEQNEEACTTLQTLTTDKAEKPTLDKQQVAAPLSTESTQLGSKESVAFPSASKPANIFGPFTPPATTFPGISSASTAPQFTPLQPQPSTQFPAPPTQFPAPSAQSSGIKDTPQTQKLPDDIPSSEQKQKNTKNESTSTPVLTPPVTSEPALPSQQESSGFLIISGKKNEPKPAIAPQPPTHEQQPIDSNVASTSSNSQKNAVAPSIKSDSASSSSSQVAPKNTVAPSIRSDSTSSSTPGTFTNSFSEVKNSFGVSSAFTGIGSSSSSAFTGIGSSSWPPSAAAPMSDLHLNDANAPLPETGKSVFANQEPKKPIVVINAEDVKQGLYNSYSEEDEDEDENEKPEDSEQNEEACTTLQTLTTDKAEKPTLDKQQVAAPLSTESTQLGSKESVAFPSASKPANIFGPFTPPATTFPGISSASTAPQFTPLQPQPSTQFPAPPTQFPAPSAQSSGIKDTPQTQKLPDDIPSSEQKQKNTKNESTSTPVLTPPVTSEPALPSQQESSGFLIISGKKNEPKPAIAPQPPTHEQQPIDSNVASTSSNSQKNAVAPSIKSDSASSSSSQVAPKNTVAPSIRSDSTSSSTPGTFTNSFSEVKNSFGVSSAFTGIGSSSSSAFTGIGSSSWPPSAAAPMSDLHLNDANAPLPETGKSVFANQEPKKPIVVINAEDVKQGLYNSYSEEDEDEDENEKPEDSEQNEEACTTLQTLTTDKAEKPTLDKQQVAAPLSTESTQLGSKESVAFPSASKPANIFGPFTPPATTFPGISSASTAPQFTPLQPQPSTQFPAPPTQFPAPSAQSSGIKDTPQTQKLPDDIPSSEQKQKNTKNESTSTPVLTPPVTSEPALPSQQESSGFFDNIRKKE